MNKSDSEANGPVADPEGFTKGGARRLPTLSSSIPARCATMPRTGPCRGSAGRAKGNPLTGGDSVVTGCMAQRIGGGHPRQGRWPTSWSAPTSLPGSANCSSTTIAGRRKNSFLSLEPEDFAGQDPPGLLSKRDDFPWHKWVTITHGCENCCTYCIVPYVRGKLVSVPSGKILAYVRGAGRGGVTRNNPAGPEREPVRHRQRRHPLRPASRKGRARSPGSAAW